MIPIVHMLSNTEPDLHDLIITTFNKNNNQLYSFEVKLHLGWCILFLLSVLQVGNGINNDSVFARLEPKVVCTGYML